MITKKDCFYGAITGLITGIFSLFIFYFLNIDFYLKEVVLLFVVPVVWAFGVYLGGFLGKYVPFFTQFGKFAVVGFLSTSIDFFILNLMSYLTGVTAGITVGWINIPGFVFAVLNGYLWNKLWVFKQSEGGVFEKFNKFLGVTILGLVINSFIIIMLTSFFLPSGIGQKEWLNFAKMLATIISMVWNFLGYKYFVFKNIANK